MAQTLGRLEALARKELAAEPFADDTDSGSSKTIDIRSRGSGVPTYSGWYCQLFYGGGAAAAEWDPTVVDVHTDPDSQSVLEEGVGSCNFLIAAIDNENDRMIYVGPAYSYYEFRHPAAVRLTDRSGRNCSPPKKNRLVRHVPPHSNPRNCNATRESKDWNRHDSRS